jgi:phage/plasmid-associated DNA primase
VDEIVEDPDELEPVKQFIKDKSLKEKLPIWAPIFASMLVERAFLNQGKVEDCPIVMAASSKYRNSQDYIAAFVTDRIIKESGKNVKQKELSEEFKIWYSSNVMRPIPANTITELNEFISKKFGSHKNKIWNGIKIRYDVPENDIVALASV